LIRQKYVITTIYKNDLIFIKTNLHQIVTTIKSLVNSNTPLIDIINLIEYIFTQLEQINGVNKSKWRSSKNKNITTSTKKPRIQILEKYLKTFSENNTVQLPESYSPTMGVVD